jgi:hypothetical protein
MSSLDSPVFTCTSCDVRIGGRPTFHVGLAFCCAGCVAGGPCTCSYDLEGPTCEPSRSDGMEAREDATLDEALRALLAERPVPVG